MAPFEDRVAMLRASIDAATASISTIEGERAAPGAPEAPSYTIDTLRALRAEVGPGVTLRLLIGADQAAQFHRWRDARGVIALAPPLVMLRTPHDAAADLLNAMRPHWSAEELREWSSRIVEVPTLDADATTLRERLATHGPDAPGLDDLLPEGARRVIRERGLYR